MLTRPDIPSWLLHRPPHFLQRDHAPDVHELLTEDIGKTTPPTAKGVGSLSTRFDVLTALSSNRPGSCPPVRNRTVHVD